MRAFHADSFVPSPPGHRFPMGKYRLLREAVERDLPELRVTEAPPAGDGELALVHDPAWIAAVLDRTTGAAQQREIGLPLLRDRGRARQALGGHDDRRRPLCPVRTRGRGRELGRRPTMLMRTRVRAPACSTMSRWLAVRRNTLEKAEASWRAWTAECRA
jgi:hypothetical protein